MNCPKCYKFNQPVTRYEPKGIKYTIHRNYKCKCGVSFKSTEKILFTTLPKEIRDKYLDNNYMDGRGQI